MLVHDGLLRSIWCFITLLPPHPASVQDTFTHARAHTYTHTHTHTHAHTHTHTHACTHAHKHAHTHTLTLAAGHPHIVQLEASYEDKHYIHLVLQLANGGELLERIVERKHYSEKDAAEVFRTMVKVRA